MPHEVVKQLNPDTLVALGEFREQMAREWNLSPQEKDHLYDEAQQAYKRAIETDPKYLPAYIALARFFDTTNRHDKAMATYEKALKINPKDAGMWCELGMVYARQKEWEPALRDLKKATELAPDERAFARNYGMCLARAGHYDESLAVLRHCMAEAEAQCVIARMLHHLNQDEASMQHLQLALQADPNLKSGQSLLAELQTGTAPTAPNPQGPVEEPRPLVLTGGTQ
jgi:tetratricopeptide (TPR) repeat protein